MRWLILLVAVTMSACAPEPDVLTFSGSAVGREAEVLQRQLARFSADRGIEVRIRATPDSADQRHQLYVQWLNARSADPDVLQLDVIWTPEFAAAGWLLPLDAFAPDTTDFFPATIEANRWRGSLYGLPWFVDVGMLYWRTDLFPSAPQTLDDLRDGARRAIESGAVRHGLALQAARYEGLITVFVEYLGAFGGEILDERGAVAIDSPAAVNALTWLRAAIDEGIVPSAALTWQEEQARFAFQNGAAAAMRNWPYAQALLAGPDSAVAGRFTVAAMPGVPGAGRSTAALGGSQLAINRYTRQAADAWALVAYLTAPAQMLERARDVGQYPSRPSAVEDETTRTIIAAARPRPVTPVYTQLSEILQWVFDERGVGNGLGLPAGPLRQPLPARLPAQAHVLYNAPAPSTPLPGALAERGLAGALPLPEWTAGRAMRPQALAALAALATPDRPLPAIAGIAVPQRFFTMLRDAGITITERALPDHAPLHDLPWPAGTPEVICTEKDAAKLSGRALGGTRVWVVGLDFRLPAPFVADLLAQLPAPRLS